MPDAVQQIMENEMLERDPVRFGFLAAVSTEVFRDLFAAIEANSGFHSV